MEDMEELRELAQLLDSHTDFGQRFAVADLLE